MASDWIKLRVDIFRDPAVLRMSDICRTNRHHIVGLLSDVWGWIDGHTVDGSCPNIPPSMIDAYVGLDGFAAAMAAVGWLESKNEGVIVPRWDRHNTNTAKARSLESEAKKLRRENVGQNVGHMSDKKGSKCRTREEKRREEKKDTPKPPTDPFAGMSETRKATFETWLRYKAERGQKYKPTGLKALITEHSKLSDAELSAAVQSSMASNYTGIFPPKGPGPATASGRVFRNPDGTTFISEKNY